MESAVPKPGSWMAPKSPEPKVEKKPKKDFLCECGHRESKHIKREVSFGCGEKCECAHFTRKKFLPKEHLTTRPFQNSESLRALQKEQHSEKKKTQEKK